MLNLTHKADSIKNYTMNKISSFCLLVLLTAIFNPHAYASELSEVELEQRVENLYSAVDVRYNHTVKRHINAYTKYNKAGSETLLGRVSLYFPLFEKVLREKGLPDELKYLPIIESSLRPTATSHVGAAGLWQFMKPTGRMMGLKITRTVDERRDPLKSTEAAADYLAYLYERFGDWTLALAAYNCGPGNVRKAIKRSGGKTTFWEIEKYLPRETRNYIPKFIAATYLMHYYYDYNLIPDMPEQELVNTATAKVYDQVLLKKLSAKYNVSLATVKLLNPAYIRNVIPASDEGKHYLTLPKHMMYDYISQTQSATLLAPVQPVVAKKEVKVEVKQEARSIIEIDVLLKEDDTTKHFSPTARKLYSIDTRRSRSDKQLSPEWKALWSDKAK